MELLCSICKNFRCWRPQRLQGLNVLIPTKMFSVSGTLELPQTLERNIPSTYSIVHILIVSDFPDCHRFGQGTQTWKILFHNQPLLNNYMYIYFTDRAIIRIWVINRIMTSRYTFRVWDTGEEQPSNKLKCSSPVPQT